LVERSHVPYEFVPCPFPVPVVLVLTEFLRFQAGVQENPIPEDMLPSVTQSCCTRGMRALSLCNHLQRRGSSGNYYFRVRIPSDLLEVYAPKKEIVFSLKTKDPKEAKARFRVEAVRVDQEFAEHRRRLELERQQQEQLAQSQGAGRFHPL